VQLGDLEEKLSLGTEQVAVLGTPLEELGEVARSKVWLGHTVLAK
jgi:hypothetical protein